VGELGFGVCGEFGSGSPCFWLFWGDSDADPGLGGSGGSSENTDLKKSIEEFLRSRERERVRLLLSENAKQRCGLGLLGLSVGRWVLLRCAVVRSAHREGERLFSDGMTLKRTGLDSDRVQEFYLKIV